MISILQLVWPYFERESRKDAVEQTLRDFQDRDLIADADWSVDTNIALEQARLLVSAETERRRGAETKASIYLAVIAAIIPVLSSLLTDFFAEDLGELPPSFQGIFILLFVVGITYLIASGIWAFKTLAVSAHTRVDATDLARLWGSGNAAPGLVRELLISTRINHGAVNKKMDCIKMAHEFLLRTYLTFAALILVIVLWEPFSTVSDKLWPWVSRVWLAATS